MYSNVTIYLKKNRNTLLVQAGIVDISPIAAVMKMNGLSYEALKLLIIKHRFETNSGIGKEVEYTYDVDLAAKVVRAYCSSERIYRVLSLDIPMQPHFKVFELKRSKTWILATSSIDKIAA